MFEYSETIETDTGVQAIEKFSVKANDLILIGKYGFLVTQINVSPDRSSGGWVVSIGEHKTLTGEELERYVMASWRKHIVKERKDE